MPLSFFFKEKYENSILWDRNDYVLSHYQQLNKNERVYNTSIYLRWNYFFSVLYNNCY